MREKYIEECKVLQQNCTYTAETHHLMAKSYRSKALRYQLAPAIVAAISGASLTIGQAADWVPLLATASSIVSAVATVLNPNKNYEEHLSAAKAFTVLKNDLRFVSESEATALEDGAFFERVRNLHDKYNALVMTVPATESKFFEKARKVVQAGLHEPDRRDGAVM